MAKILAFPQAKSSKKDAIKINGQTINWASHVEHSPLYLCARFLVDQTLEGPLKIQKDGSLLPTILVNCPGYNPALQSNTLEEQDLPNLVLARQILEALGILETTSRALQSANLPPWYAEYPCLLWQTLFSSLQATPQNYFHFPGIKPQDLAAVWGKSLGLIYQLSAQSPPTISSVFSWIPEILALEDSASQSLARLWYQYFVQGHYIPLGLFNVAAPLGSPSNLNFLHHTIQLSPLGRSIL